MMTRRELVSLPRRSLLGGALAALAGHSTLAADSQQRVLVFGDSQAQGLAGGVQRLFRSDKSHRVLDRSKISTGLVTRPNYDWPVQAHTIAADDHADVAVALFGANDRPPVRIGGHVDPDRFAQFRSVYAARVADVAGAFKAAGVPLIWLGHPIVRDAAYSEDMALLNAIYAEAAEAEGAVFVPTWDLFKGPDGGFSLYGKGLDGQTVRLRADDGVHLTPAGYDVVAAMLAPLFDQIRSGIPARSLVVGSEVSPKRTL